MNKNRFYNPFENLNLQNNAQNYASENNSGIGRCYDGANATDRQVSLIRADNNERIIVNKSSFTIGKNGSSDYVIMESNAISRKHAEIRLLNNEVYIVDKKSTNKTYVNGTPIESEMLVKVTNGDEIKLANVIFNIYIK